MLIYLTNAALLDAAVISAIIAVSKLFDGISDLIIGDIVDRTVSKLGKARTWLIRMCIPYAVSAQAGGFAGIALFVRMLLLFTDKAGNQNSQRAYTCTLAVYGLIMVIFVLIMGFSTRERGI